MGFLLVLLFFFPLFFFLLFFFPLFFPPLFFLFLFCGLFGFCTGGSVVGSFWGRSGISVSSVSVAMLHQEVYFEKLGFFYIFIASNYACMGIIGHSMEATYARSMNCIVTRQKLRNTFEAFNHLYGSS
jgi:hypothetical protein